MHDAQRGHALPDPTRSNIFIDSCAFDPKHEPETAAANKIRALEDAGRLRLIIAHSTVKELEHPNVPQKIKQDAVARIRSLQVELTAGEDQQKRRILEILAGNGKPENMVQDADHVFEAQKYGGGYFLTVDKGILRKAPDIHALCGVNVMTPSSFLAELGETLDGTEGRG